MEHKIKRGDWVQKKDEHPSVAMQVTDIKGNKAICDRPLQGGAVQSISYPLECLEHHKKTEIDDFGNSANDGWNI